MWQELRDYWLPMMLFAATLLLAIALVLAVIVAPFLPAVHVLIELYAADATVRRTSLAAAVGLIVTAFVFFRPNASVLSRKSPKKPPHDTMAGA